METQNYVLRVYGDGTYGVGREVAPNVYLFKADEKEKFYGLTKEEALKKLAKLR